MFRVWISFMNCIDEFGYPCECYEFKDKAAALEFYDIKKSEYKDEDFVSVDLSF